MKQLKDLVAGDYVFSIPTNHAILITSEYEDGNYMTCSLSAINKFPDCYRIATQEEIIYSIQRKKEFVEHVRNVWKKIIRNED